MFDDIMFAAPIWFPSLVGGVTIIWLTTRSATLSALRKHTAEQNMKQDR
ncbi:hypothetical protein AB0O87_10545 [Microbacterium sp. NPDC076768]